MKELQIHITFGSHGKMWCKKYTLARPLESSLTREENEDVEFKMSKLEKVVESMKDEIKQELDAFKYNLHAIRGTF